MKTFILAEKKLNQEEARALTTNIRDLVRIAGYYTHHEEASKCLELISHCADNLDLIIKRLTVQAEQKVTLY